jgi:hypothetical protein
MPRVPQHAIQRSLSHEWSLPFFTINKNGKEIIFRIQLLDASSSEYGIIGAAHNSSLSVSLQVCFQGLLVSIHSKAVCTLVCYTKHSLGDWQDQAQDSLPTLSYKLQERHAFHCHWSKDRL